MDNLRFKVAINPNPAIAPKIAEGSGTEVAVNTPAALKLLRLPNLVLEDANQVPEAEVGVAEAKVSVIPFGS